MDHSVNQKLARSDSLAPILTMAPELPNTNELDPRVVLYPTIGTPLPGGDVWRVIVQGRIMQSAPASFSKRLMLRGLVSALELSPEMASSSLFAERVEGFLASPIPGQRIQVELAGQHYVLQHKSRRSGLFSCKLDLPANFLSSYRSYGPSERPRTSSSAPASGIRSSIPDARVPVFLADQRGVSVVSDIDDTIKLTEVNSRRRMLQRTFAEPFEPIAGMAEAYRGWEQEGALFHYVSSSPWQIFPPVSKFLRDESFPDGSMHLKWFRLRDELFKGWRLLRRKSKGGVIRALIKRMPERKFVLVGDSGERDPEIYAKLASKFPIQVTRICIRQIDAKPLDLKRLEIIYKRYGFIIPIQVFTHAKELGSLLSTSSASPAKSFVSTTMLNKSNGTSSN